VTIGAWNRDRILLVCHFYWLPSCYLSCGCDQPGLRHICLGEAIIPTNSRTILNGLQSGFSRWITPASKFSGVSTRRIGDRVDSSWILAGGSSVGCRRYFSISIMMANPWKLPASHINLRMRDLAL
jgi:hypothetical protein